MARVRLFASLREIAGTSHLDVEGDTIGDAVSVLAARFGPEFERRLETSRVWKNGEEGAADDPITDADELAVIPPVSGGAYIGTTGAGIESLVVAGMALLLLVGNALGTPYLLAVWVGVAALWVIDLAFVSSEGDFTVDHRPLLVSILVSMASAITFGVPGLGVGLAISVVVVMGWSLVRPEARDLTTLSASVMCALVASLSVSSVLLARASEAGGGDRRIAGLLIIALLGTLIGRVAERSRSRLADPYLMASFAIVLSALAVAYVSGFELLPWFFLGLGTAGAVIAGRGIGSAFRTGRVQLVIRPDGYLTALDGPMLAVAIFAPAMWLVF